MSPNQIASGCRFLACAHSGLSLTKGKILTGMFLGSIVRFGFPRREDSKVISAKKEVFFKILLLIVR